MKKFKAILILIILATASIFPAGSKEDPDNHTEPCLVFTDDLGRVREFYSPLDRIAPSGNLSQMVLYSVAKDKMVGLSSTINNKAMQYIDENTLSLPLFGTFYGRRSNLNREEVILASPDVIIDMGEIKGSVENIASDLNTLERDLNIPVVFIECYLENTAQAYRRLGELLDTEDECEIRAEYAERAISIAKEKREEIKDVKRVYYSSSTDALNAIESGSFHGEVIELVGAENVVPNTFSEGNGIASFEELIIWNPDVILLSEKDAYSHVLSDPTWNTLDAVKNKNVYLIPSEPYPFIDNPPSINRIIGIYWLGSLLYPDLYSDINLEEELKEFYSLFYSYELSDEEIKKLLS